MTRPESSCQPAHPHRLLDVSGNRRLRYVPDGEGRNVVLIHGTLVTLEDMVVGPMDRLARTFRVTAFDRPGHGLSTRGRLEGTLTDQAALLREGIQALGLQRPILVGHSLGASLAVHYAIRYPADVAGVVALAPLVLPELRLEQVLFGARSLPGVGDMLTATTGPARDRMLTPVLWNTMFLPQTMPGRFLAEFPFWLAGRPGQMQAVGEDSAQVAPDLLANLGAYPQSPVPMVVMGGDRDMVVAPLHGRLLAQALPRGRHVTLRGCGHMLHHFHQDAVAAAVGSLVA